MAAPKKPSKVQGTTGQVYSGRINTGSNKPGSPIKSRAVGRNNAGPNPYRQQINQGGPNRTYGSYGLPESASVTRQSNPSIGPRTGKPAAGYAPIPTSSQTGSRMKSTPAGPTKWSGDGTKIVPKAKSTKPASRPKTVTKYRVGGIPNGKGGYQPVGIPYQAPAPKAGKAKPSTVGIAPALGRSIKNAKPRKK